MRTRTIRTSMTKAAAALTAAAMTLSFGTTAFAAESDSSYGYQIGQQKYDDRHAVFEQANSFSTDAEREAFFAANGIGGDGPHSGQEHLDLEARLAAGEIDQETADKLAEEFSARHEELHAKYASKDSMTPEELHDFYESLGE